ncbi:MAG: hypothetical protein R3C99_26670 [Pirellulaceae bacterium]
MRSCNARLRPSDDELQSEAARLAEEEAELLGKTESLTAALESKVGPIPPLHRAIEAMRYATTSLAVRGLADGRFQRGRGGAPS